MLAFGQGALINCYADQALTVADALIARNPNNSSALALQAQALRVLERWPESEAAAKAAWVRRKPPHSGISRRLWYKQALSLQRHRTEAQFWLRFAVQDAPSTAAQSPYAQNGVYALGHVVAGVEHASAMMSLPVEPTTT